MKSDSGTTFKTIASLLGKTTKKKTFIKIYSSAISQKDNCLLPDMYKPERLTYSQNSIDTYIYIHT